MEIPLIRMCWLALACLILVMALWGSSYVVLEVIFRRLPLLWVISGRMALGSLVFLVAWRQRERIDYRSGDWKYLLGLAVCEPCLYSLYESFALQYTSAVQAGMITALLPLLVTAGAQLLLHERASRMTWIGFSLAVLGSIWLSPTGESDLRTPQPLPGDFFELLVMLCTIGYTLLLKHLPARYSAFVLTAMQAFVGMLFFLPLALTSADLPSQPSALGIQTAVYLGVVVTAGTYGLHNFDVGRLPAGQASGFINLTPVFTLVFATLFLGEILNDPQTLAVDLAFIDIVISRWHSALPLSSAGVLN